MSPKPRAKCESEVFLSRDTKKKKFDLNTCTLFSLLLKKKLTIDIYIYLYSNMYVLIYSSIYLSSLKNSQESYVRITNPLFLRDLPNVPDFCETHKERTFISFRRSSQKIDTFAQDHLYIIIYHIDLRMQQLIDVCVVYM